MKALNSDRWFYGALLANVAQGGSSLLIPLYATIVLDATVGDVGWITGIASWVGVLASLLWGRLSDRLGRRKPFVLIGFLGLTASLGLMGLSRSVGQLIVLNALLNLTWLASAAVVTLLAIADTDQWHWESRIGVLHRQMGVGWVLGLMLGSLWTGSLGLMLGGQEISLRSLFFVLATLSAAGALFATRWIREQPLPQPVEERRFQGLALAAGQLIERFKFAPFRLYHIVSPRRLWMTLRGGNEFGLALTRYFYAVIVFFIGFSMFFIPYPIFLKDQLGLGSAEIFALWVVHSGMSAYFNLRVGKLVERWENRHLQRTALLLRASVFLGAGLFLPQLAGHPGPARVLIAFFFVLTGISWAVVNITAIALISWQVREGLRGQALGTYNALSGLGSVIGSILGGQIARVSYPLAFMLAAAFVLLGWWLTRFSFVEEHARSRQSASALLR